jgi:cytochrome c-type biogenesis protein CcmH/NrfG
MKRVDEGIKELETAVSLKDDDYDARVTLGMAYRQRGDYPKAITNLRKATELKPTQAVGWSNLGVALSKTADKSDKEESVRAFKKAIDLDPKSGQNHFNLAVVYRQQKHVDDAIAEYQAAVELDPLQSGAYYDLGLLYAQDRRYEEALDAFKKYLATNDKPDPASQQDAEERIKSLEPVVKKGKK